MSNRPASVPALLYHEVWPAERVRNSYTVDAATFGRQLDLIRDRGLHGAVFRDYWRDGAAIDGRAVIVTFDDAHLCNYTVALPALVARGLVATFFLPTAYVGRTPQEVVMPQLREMADAGMEIGSHTHSHPFLDELDAAAAREELRRSKAILEDGLGRRVEVLACPGGRFKRSTLEVAREVGYRAVCTSRPRLNRQARGRGFYLFDRFLMKGGTSDADFRAIVTRDRRLARMMWSYRAKRLARGALGNRLYHALWERVAG